MRKSILRFGALALMSMMSIGSWAQSAKDVITLDNSTLNGEKVAGEYLVLPGGETVCLTKATGSASGIYEFPDPVETQDTHGPGWIKSQTGKYFKVVEIGANAFDGIKNETLTIPSTVTKIGEKAFAWMGDGTSATTCSITFANTPSLTSLGDNAFNMDEEVTTTPTRRAGSAITIANATVDLSNVTNYGTYVFDGVTFSNANATVKLGEITTVPEGLFCNASGIMVVDFGNDGANGGGLTKISKKAFYGVASIQSFGYRDTDGKYYLPKNLTIVGDNAFNGALHATPTTTEFIFSRTNAGKITTVEAGAFANCKVIDNAHFENLFVSSNSIAGLTYNSNSFNGCSLSGTLNLSTSAVNDNNKKYIPSYAFANNDVTTVVLPADLKVIGEAAFLGCSSLESCALPAGLEKIEASAFKNANAYGATSVPVIIPNTVTFIGEDAFTRTYEAATDANAVNNRIIKIQPKENTGTGINYVSTVIESWKYVSDVKTATKPIADYSKTDLYVPMGLSKSYATLKTGEYDWSGAATNNLYTYGSPLTATTSKIYNGCYEYTVATNWSPKYTTGRTETPEVKLTGVMLDVESYVSPFPAEGAGYRAKFPKDGTVLNIPKTVVKQGENSNDKSFVWYTVVGVNANALQHTTTSNQITYGLKKQIKTINIQADSLELADVFTGYEKLETVNFCAIPTDNKSGWAGANALKPTNVNLGNNAFKDCAKLANFNAEEINGVANADYNSNLKYSAEIGESAFENDKALKNFVITDNVTLLDTKAFCNTGLTSINIPNSVCIIRSEVFDAALDPDADDFAGVRDITVNWNAGDARTFYINDDAFGNEISHWRGSKLEYLPRRLYIPAGSATFYNTTTHFSTSKSIFSDAHLFTLGEAVNFTSATNPSGRLDVRIDVDNLNQEIRTLAFTDDNTITELEVKTADPTLMVEYTRDFKSLNQQAWFVPFTLPASQYNGCKFYKIFDTQLEEINGELCPSLELVEVTGDIKANTPYIVIPARAEAITFGAQGIVKTDVAKTVTVSDIENSYTIAGTYLVKTGTPGSFYALNENAFHPNEKATTQLHACRIFLTKTGRTSPYIKTRIITDEDVTAIENVKANSLNAPMFDLQGRQIAAPAKGQVYIQNGVKKLAR